MKRFAALVLAAAILTSPVFADSNESRPRVCRPDTAQAEEVARPKAVRKSDDASEEIRPVDDCDPSQEEFLPPLENGWITVSRASGNCTFPARFILCAAMNPCPCGRGEYELGCTCRPEEKRRYRKKISGPLLDRIDLQVEVRQLSEAELLTAEREMTATPRKAGRRGDFSFGKLRRILRRKRHFMPRFRLL